MLATMFLTQMHAAKKLRGSKGRSLIAAMGKKAGTLLGVFMLLLLSFSSRSQTVGLTSQPAVVCDGQFFLLNAVAPVGLPAGVTVVNYVYYTTASDSLVTPNGSVSRVKPVGVYNPYIVAILSDGSRIQSTPITVTVWNKPVAGFVALTNLVQCFKNNSSCFQNTAVQAAQPSAPIVWTIWDYGDGFYDSAQHFNNVCHPYGFTGNFTVIQRVVDSLGCYTDISLPPTMPNPIYIKPNIIPSFKWTRRTGPCYTSEFLFENLTALNVNEVQSYTWYFGDGSKYTATAPFSIAQRAFYDSIPHTYTINGEFTPALSITDTTGCTDSILYTNQNASQQIPKNIVIEISITTTASAVNMSPRDSVCIGSHNNAEICFKQDPIPFLSPADILWTFDDPPSLQLNFDNTTWNPCHAFTGMKTFYPTLTLLPSSPCPGTYTYYSTITLDDDKFIDKHIYVNNDKIDTPNSYPRFFSDTVISPRHGAGVTKLKYMGFFEISEDGTDSLFSYKGKYDKPVFKISTDSLIYNSNGTVKDSFDLPPNFSYVVVKPLPLKNDTFTGYNYWGYGVRVIGPFARIEDPPNGVTVASNQKNQCGPNDTVDLVNTSLYYKSRKMWRRWDFDDNFAPQCTSFSVPKAGFPPVVGTSPLDSISFDNGLTYVKMGPDTVRMWDDARQQYDNSNHYFIANGQTYGGKMPCKFSFDTLPRHGYPNWDTVFRWYEQGKDFMPWDPATYGPGGIPIHPADTMWWGKPVYLDPVSGQWSLIQNSGPAPYGQWVRIDTMKLKYNNDQDLRDGTPINLSLLPDPFRSANANGSYNVINGGSIKPTNSISYKFNGTTYTINGYDTLPGNIKMTFYRYAFLRTITRCITVRLKLQDSLNNETTLATDLDPTKLDTADCWMQATLTLPFAKADARGLAKRGRECPGASPNGPFFEMGPRGSYPGVKPSCGQTFILFNFDSLADRFDNTPCVLDAFVTYSGNTTTPLPGTPSTTPGGLVTPAFFTAPNFNQPPTVWQSPGSTTIAWHYGLNAPASRPPPADTALGWITVGVVIGSGIKDTVITGVPYNDYLAQLGYYGDASGTIPNPGIKTAGANAIDRPVNYNPGSSPVPGAPTTYNYAFSQLKNFRTVPLGLGFVDLVDIEYIDGKWPKCISDTVWYHRFLRINNLTAKYFVDPVNCRLRHKGEDVTVHYEDSIQDEIKFSTWVWGDNTFTVDSFFYAPDSTPTLTDGYFINGVRRVRYNFDMHSGSNVLLDSTVWPVRASGIGAVDGLQPGLLTAPVAYNLTNKCTGGANPNPTWVTVDTALMFLPLTHTFVRTSWEAQYKLPGSRTGDLQHLIGSVRGCFQSFGVPMTIGIIDTFDIQNGDGVSDTTFCENEPVYFVDSLRYWRWDCLVTELPFIPAVTKSPAYTGALADFPFSSLQIDSADFWRQDVGDPRPIQDVKFSPGFQGKIQIDTVVPERIYWDFGDGSPIDSSMRPVHHYATFGRYMVTMYSKDSLRGFDTCVRFLNISKPVAKIGFTKDGNGFPKDVFNCGDFADLIDSSSMDPSTLAGALDSIKGNWWWFGENKLDTITFNSKDNKFPKNKYQNNGLFRVKLVVETYQGCKDTTYDSVFVRGPRPQFALVSPSDTIGCAPFKVRLLNLADSTGKYVDPLGNSLPNDTPTVVTFFRFGEPAKPDLPVTGRRDTIEYTYTAPGEYYISAFGADGIPNICNLVMYPDTNNQPKIKITVLNLHREVLLDKNVICKDRPVVISNNSDSLYLSYEYEIHKDSLNTPTDTLFEKPHSKPFPSTFPYTFEETGHFTILARPKNMNPIIPLSVQSNCKANDTLLLDVVTPSPSFTVDTMETPKFKMTNTSDTTLNDDYVWLVRKVGTSQAIMNTPYNGNNQDPDFEFDLENDTGTFEICLTSLAKGIPTIEACEDSVCQTVKVTFTINVEVPNVFSPNGDGINDEFKIRIEGEQKYQLTIYNRWGAKVFESGEAKTMWNGKNQNDGAECPAGVYYYIFDYQLRTQADKTRTGTVTVIR
jgi:gliding motility-associated-like protein